MPIFVALAFVIGLKAGEFKVKHPELVRVENPVEHVSVIDQGG